MIDKQDYIPNYLPIHVLLTGVFAGLGVLITEFVGYVCYGGPFKDPMLYVIGGLLFAVYGAIVSSEWFTLED